MRIMSIVYEERQVIIYEVQVRIWYLLYEALTETIAV